MQSAESAPVWLTSQTGITGKVPKPWVAVKAQRDVFSCWERQYDFGGALFPRQISVAGEKMLAGPVVLRACLQGKYLSSDQGCVKSMECHEAGRFARRVAVGFVGDLLVTTNVTLFYDGAMRRRAGRAAEAVGLSMRLFYPCLCVAARLR